MIWTENIFPNTKWLHLRIHMLPYTNETKIDPT